VWLLCGIVGYALARSLAYARIKPFWIDEVLTQVVSGLPGLTAIWKALVQGADGQPPLFYLLERYVALLIPNEELGYRLLSILAFACTLTLLYYFVAKRSGPFPALVSAAVLLTTQLFTYYAAEARPYSLLTAFVALALLCYQRAASSAWLVGLFLSLLLACSIHFYGVLELLPFFIAELTIVYLKRKIRFAVWLALLLPPLSLIPYVPLLLSMQHHWGKHFWNQSYLGPGYSTFFGAGNAWGTAFAGTAIVALAISFFRAPHDAHAEESSAESTAERVLILSLILVPLVGYAAGKFGHVAFVNRYVVPGTLGVAAAGGYVLGRARPLVLGLAATLVLFAIGIQEKEFLGFSTADERSPSTC
jgi:4-amino-4-deoxy-L-arabinose transferase-like glycosyltransferase